ncbi:GTPase-activating protein [Coemansia sp. RSA 2559]|nr:GTPase-activating protein [Coemansia sp. RSA 2559]KAJ2869228.1 GTPase-activating protein [Coemansia erecta]
MTELDTAPQPKVKKSLRTKRLMRPGATGGGKHKPSVSDDVTTTPISATPPPPLPSMSLKEGEDEASPNHSMPSLLTPETADKNDNEAQGDEMENVVVNPSKLEPNDEEEEDHHSTTDTETLLANGTHLDTNAAQQQKQPRGSIEEGEDEDAPRKSADNDSKTTTTASSVLRRSSEEEEDNFVEANDGGHTMSVIADNIPSEPKDDDSAAAPSYSDIKLNEDAAENESKEQLSLLDYFEDPIDFDSNSPHLETVQEAPIPQKDTDDEPQHTSSPRKNLLDGDVTKSDLIMSPPLEAELESAHSKAVSKSNLGRSTSLRFGGSVRTNKEGGGGGAASLSPEGRRRPSEIVSPAKKSNRRSIMLTSFVPPVSSTGNSPSRSSGESSRSAEQAAADQPISSGSVSNNNGVVEITIGGKTFHRSSMLDGQLAGSNTSSIRLRPSNDVSASSASAAVSPPSQQDSAKTALKSIGEKIGVFKERADDDDDSAHNTPDWVKEVQRRKREAQERDEAVRAKRNAAKTDDVPVVEPPTASGPPLRSAVEPPASAENNDEEDVPLTEIDLNDDSGSRDANILPLDRDKPLPAIDPAALISTARQGINRTFGNSVSLVQGKRSTEQMEEEQVSSSSSSTPLNAASARSIYRSLSASLGIGQQQPPQPEATIMPRGGSVSDRPPPASQQQHMGPPLPTVHERNRSTSQTNSNQSPASSGPGGLFAAVSSFFGRSSTQQSAPPSATMLSTPGSRKSSSTHSSSPSNGNQRGGGGGGTFEFPGMRPSNSDAPRPVPQLPTRMSSSLAGEGKKSNNEMDSLLNQLEAQNQQILKDNKARVFTRETLDESLENQHETSGEDEESKIDWDFWGNLINNYEKTTRAEPRRLAQMIYAGIPKAVRGTVWQVMAGSRNDPALGATFRKLAAQKTEPGSEDFKHEKQIRHDLARTFPKLEYFKDTDGAGQEGLYNVLRAYALFDAEVGYCQGLSFIVGPLLLNMPDEEAFGVLVRLMYRYGLRGHFLPSMDDLQLRLYQFEHAFRETLPRLAAHFHAQGVEHTMYVSQWMMTLFAYRLPIQLTFRLFDVVFAEGLDSLLRFAIAVLKRSQTRLLSLNFEAILQYLNEGPLFAFYSHASPDMLVKDANQVTAINGRYLQKLRRGYIEEMQRRIEAEDEGNRMRAENEMLKQENQALRASAQKMANSHSEVRAELEKNRAEAKSLSALVAGLEEKLRLERKSAEETATRDELDQLAQKNVQLNIKNQQLEDSLQDMEAALVQIKLLYAESEEQRETMTKKFDDLRRALH